MHLRVRKWLTHQEGPNLLVRDEVRVAAYGRREVDVASQVQAEVAVVRSLVLRSLEEHVRPLPEEREVRKRRMHRLVDLAKKLRPVRSGLPAFVVTVENGDVFVRCP